MKKMKKSISALLAVSMTASSFAANAAIGASALDTGNMTILQIEQQWNSLIQQEKQKFPEKKDGKQCYWNGGDINSYTTKPCGHSFGGVGSGCNSYSPVFYSSETYKVIEETGPYGSHLMYSQCAGFAAKLQEDIFDNATIVRLTTDLSGHYTALNGKVVSYNFKKGDSVRFGNHSIFITGVNGNKLTFAQCNADGHCAIDWDATTYNGQTITASYLKAHLSYIDRPMMTGDLNLDGVINSEDATVFDNTLKKDGATIGNAPVDVYDTNYDGVVNETDYNRIKNMSGSTLNGVRYVNATKRTVTPIWMNTTVYTTDYTFMTADGNFYSTENGLNGGATFYGNFNATKTNVTVPATVTNPKNNTTYQVTSVGYYGGREPGNKLISKIKTLNLPYTVRQINRYAFWNAALQNIKFPSNSTLKTVEDCAFMHAESLNYVQFPPSLETIGSQAFDSCKQLVSVYMTPDSTGNGKFRSMGDGAFLHCPNLWKVRIANNKDYRIFIGENGSVFDDNDESVRLELPNTIANNPGILHFAGASDVAKWRNVTLHIDCGNYIIYDNNFQVAATHPSTAISSVYPN